MDAQRPMENWPDKEFLETALRKWLGDTEITIREFTSRIATSKGDNYTSDMFRVTIQCEQKEDPLSIIIKRIIRIEAFGDTILQSSPFDKEDTMLRDILPAMCTVLKAALPDVEPFGAGYVYSTPGILVMEDLQPEGFRMAQRRSGLDLKHCSLVIRTLARYHAASVLLMERKSTDFSKVEKTHLREKHEIIDNFFNGTLKTLAEAVKNMEGLEKYSAKISTFANESFRERLRHIMEYHEEGDLRVLSHGDLWTNNILFRYAPSGEPDGVRFVDLQMPCITSPCIDLHYFLNSSSNEMVRTTCVDQLIEEYHEKLCETMSALQCSTRPPTLEKLRKNFDKRTIFGMFSAFSVLPIVLAEPGQFEVSDIEEGQNIKLDLYGGKAYKKAMEWFLPLFERKGFL